MLNLIMWWSGIVLESVILLRALQQKALGRYPFFLSVCCEFVVC